MMNMDAEKAADSNLVIESPLTRWPGKLELPHPDVFNGDHWNAWRAAMNKREKSGQTINMVLAYGGLEFLAQKGGIFAIEGVTLDEVRSWETDAARERVKLVSWLGREFRAYIQEVTDPKG